MELREERDGDRDAIWEVNRRAFETEAEATLVDRLRADGAVRASIVAVERERIIGHAMYSPAVIEYESTTLVIGALGPVAVLPECQRIGVGSLLIREGNERCKGLALPAIVVLGRPAYYRRFGFEPAVSWDLRCEFEVPADAFMIVWSCQPQPGPGLVRYHRAFAEV